MERIFPGETCGFSINAWSEKRVSNNSGGHLTFLVNQGMKLVSHHGERESERRLWEEKQMCLTKIVKGMV